MELCAIFALKIIHNIKTAAVLVSDSSVAIKKDDRGLDDYRLGEEKAILLALNTLAGLES
jgi:hypothetical protein